MHKNFNKEQSLVNDQMKNDLMKKLSSSTCGTDMYPEAFTMKSKLVNSDEIDEYHHRTENSEDEEKLDDDAENYKNNTKIPNSIFSSQHSEHKHKKHSTEESFRESTEKENKSHQSNQSNNTSESNNSGSDSYKKPKFDENDESTWTKEELMLKKLDIFRKLGELTQCGVKLTKNYTLDSDYKAMKFEHDLHVNIRAKRNSVNWMSKMMVGIVQGIELMNDSMNPFDMKFEKQWSNNVKHDMNDYYDVLGDIYEKYSTPGKKMAPELKLFLMLSGSAVAIQLFKGSDSASKELEKDTDIIKSLRKKSQNNNSNSDQIDSEYANSDQKSRHSELNSEYKNKKLLEEIYEKEHQKIIQKTQDLDLINESKKAYDKLNNNIDRFSKDMILSDTVGSIKSARSTKSARSNNSQQNPIMNFNEYTKQLKINEELLKAQNIMKSLKQSSQQTKPTEQTKQPQQTKPPQQTKVARPEKVLKKMESTDSTESTESTDSTNSTESTKSTKSTRSTGLESTKSSSSTMSVRSRSHKSIEKILNNSANNLTNNKNSLVTKRVSTSSSSSSSSSSSTSSKSSKSTKSSINIDSDDIRESDKLLKQKKTSEKELTFEAISLGKTSNTSGNTSKRGRPRKNPALMIQTGIK